MKPYDHKDIEKRMQAKWAKDAIFKTEEKSDKPKCFVLDMFPYPSGEGLHVGHPKGYIATDVYSHKKRMEGFNVLHPMGFDAFGLPAENYAIKTKTNPQIAVAKNVERYKKQLEIIGFDYDWSREINTTDPKFYKWTQWIFLKLLEKGLAYESFEPINWCPFDKTGLANEDIEDGKCERCGTPVEKKPMRQWVLKITDYADRLLKGIDGLDWPESIKESQRNWIGRSEGAEISFKVKGTNTTVPVFTTRPDTLFGVTYIVLAPESSFVTDLKEYISNWKEVEAYIAKAKNKTEIERTAEEKEKTGINLEGLTAINPANNTEVPVWIADYVLGDYGTGAVMAVPAHDERDFAFAKKYSLPVIQVIEPKFVGTSTDAAIKPELPIIKRNAVCAIVRNPKDNTYLCISWKKFVMNGLVTGGIEEGEDIVEATRREIIEETGYKNLKFVRTSPVSINTFFYHRVKQQNRHAHFQFVFFDLENEERESVDAAETDVHEIVWKKQDELESFFTVFEGQFLVNLLKNPEYIHTGSGLLINSGNWNDADSEESKKKITESVGGKWVVKYKLRDWVFSRQRYWGEPIPVIHCNTCGIVPVLEKDLPVTLPNVESYEPTGTGESPLAAITDWVNVPCPKCKGPGKRETNTMPQWAGSSWYYLRYMDPHNDEALVSTAAERYWNQVDFYVGGAEHATRHLIYARFWHKFLFDIEAVTTEEPFKKLQHVGLVMGEDGQKMSKRLGNVVNPDDIVNNYGADTFRLYEMFMGPFDGQIPWSTDSMIGCRRFIERLWKFQEKISDSEGMSKETTKLLQKTIRKVGEDIDAFKFNTAIAALMTLANAIEKEKAISKNDYALLLKIVAPFAPHVTDALFEEVLGEKTSIHISPWPKAEIITDETVDIIVQVNGKKRDTVTVPVNTSEEEVFKIVESREELKKWLTGAIVKKVYVPGKLVSLVVKP